MKNILLATGLIVMTASTVAFYPDRHTPENAATNLVRQMQAPKIQIAILLDTSSSMSGLIDQARNQIWQLVNEFSKASRNGVRPALQVAVYEYGNNSLSRDNGYVRMVSNLTGELDQVSEALFSLKTNGGDEYCGFVIDSAVNELHWSTSAKDIKAIFIAGNEAFTQGPVSFREAISKAKSKGITVNTIHAGDNHTGIQSGWKEGAQLAGGDYISINHNHRVVHIDAPQDKKLAKLNKALNETYVPYGATGEQKMQRQATQDTRTEQLSSALLAKRAKSKASPLYRNSNWDLVDALEQDNIKLEQIDKEHLPAAMQTMNREAQRAYISGKASERKQIQEEINKLGKERDKYISEKKKEQAGASVNTVNDALSRSIRRQGTSKNYIFDAE